MAACRRCESTFEIHGCAVSATLKQQRTQQNTSTFMGTGSATLNQQRAQGILQTRKHLNCLLQTTNQLEQTSWIWWSLFFFLCFYCVFCFSGLFSHLCLFVYIVFLSASVFLCVCVCVCVCVLFSFWYPVYLLFCVVFVSVSVYVL